MKISSYLCIILMRIIICLSFLVIYATNIYAENNVFSINQSLINNESTPKKKQDKVLLDAKKPLKQQIDNYKNGNVIFIVEEQIDLCGETIHLPNNSVLYISSGLLSNGKIEGLNWHLRADSFSKIFENIQISGMSELDDYYPEWFGAIRNSRDIDCIFAINFCLSNFGSCNLHEGTYYIKNPIVMTSYNSIKGKGQGLHGTYIKKITKNHKTELKTTQNGRDLNKDAILIVAPSDSDPAGRYLYNYVKISNLSLIGSSEYGIIASDGRYLYIDDVFVYGCQKGIDIQYSWFIDIRNTQVNADYSKNPYKDSYGICIDDLAPYANYTTINIENCYTQHYHVGYKICNVSYSTMRCCASDHSIRNAYYIHNCHGLSMIACGNEATKLTSEVNSSAYYFAYSQVDLSSSFTAMLAKKSNAKIKALYKIDKSSSVSIKQCITDDKSKDGKVYVNNSEVIFEGEKNSPDESNFIVSSNSLVFSYMSPL